MILACILCTVQCVQQRLRQMSVGRAAGASNQHLSAGSTMVQIDGNHQAHAVRTTPLVATWPTKQQTNEMHQAHAARTATWPPRPLSTAVAVNSRQPYRQQYPSAVEPPRARARAYRNDSVESSHTKYADSDTESLDDYGRPPPPGTPPLLRAVDYDTSPPDYAVDYPMASAPGPPPQPLSRNPSVESYGEEPYDYTHSDYNGVHTLSHNVQLPRAYRNQSVESQRSVV